MKPLPPLYVDACEPGQEDRRRGGIDLVPTLKALGLPAMVTPLSAGDYAFTAEGKRYGVERKRLGDLLQCFRDGRFAGEQLPKLAESYDVVWLIVEGVWRAGDDGVLEVYKGRGRGWEPYAYGGRWMVKEVRSRLMTLTHRGGIHVDYTPGASATARWLSDLYWWGVAGWSSHGSHTALHNLADERHLLNDVGRLAAVMPGVGVKRAVYVQEKFATPTALFEAGLRDWAAIEWRSEKGRKVRFGMAAALTIRRWLRGEGE